MPRLLKSPQAEIDLDNIWFYIAQDSPKNADRFLDLIQEKCELIADFPSLGESCAELVDGLRSFPVGNYLIFYFPLEDGADIVRVMHGSRDVNTLFH
jgi:toxin ParE1/3/4